MTAPSAESVPRHEYKRMQDIAEEQADKYLRSAVEGEALRAALVELVEASDAHRRYWTRVDWGSEACEHRIMQAIAAAKALLLQVDDGSGAAS